MVKTGPVDPEINLLKGLFFFKLAPYGTDGGLLLTANFKVT